MLQVPYHACKLSKMNDCTAINLGIKEQRRNVSADFHEMSGCAGHWYSIDIGDHASPPLEPPICQQSDQVGA